MIKTISNLFRGIWLSAFVLLITNLSMAQSQDFIGSVTNPKMRSGTPDATVQVNSTGANAYYSIGFPQKVPILCFFTVGIGEQKMPLESKCCMKLLLQ